MSTLESMTDEELALAYIDGNNRAFDELLYVYSEGRRPGQRPVSGNLP